MAMAMSKLDMAITEMMFRDVFEAREKAFRKTVDLKYLAPSPQPIKMLRKKRLVQFC